MSTLYRAHQAAAIAYRRHKKTRELEICLVTSRSTGSWTWPKGTIDDGWDSRSTALKEAEEEAGLTGEIEGVPIGTYEYGKWGKRLIVEVHLMRVDEAAREWDEDGWRERKWFSPGAARKALPHEPLRVLLDRALERLGAV